MNCSQELYDNLFSDFDLEKTVKSCVVIPVKDEEEYIEKSLQSFLEQIDENGLPLDFDQFELLILINNCSDSSLDLIENFCIQNPLIKIHFKEITLDPDYANIGYVRKLLMNAAFERLSRNGGGIIMTTDSDSLVAKDWITQNRIEIENGADAVGGRILLYQNDIDKMDEFTRFHHYNDEKYQLLIAEAEEKIVDNPKKPNITHHQHFNGSFAVTTDCFRESGGIPDVKFLEDCAFFQQLKKIDAKIVHSHRVQVQTSARFKGRTQIGLSYQLNEWNNLEKNNAEIYVESAESIISRFKIKKNLYDLWEKRKYLSNSDLRMFSKLTDSNENLLNSFKISKFFGLWYEDFLIFQQSQGFESYPPVAIEKAISELQKAISEL